MSLYILLLIIVIVPSWIVSARFKNKIKKYSKQPLYQNFTGREIAEKMLADHGINDVKITEAKGILSDHYNPASKTISLSQQVYHDRSVASAAIAAHECGHAVQHATAYHFLRFRSALVPVVSFSSRIITWVILAGILLLNRFPELMLAGIVLFALTTLFSFITLPVEFNASKRAALWLQTANITNSKENIAVKDGLKWAAMTYVVAAIGSLATLVYYILIFLGSRD
jgi:Zn-dependent membrane protease YugP